MTSLLQRDPAERSHQKREAWRNRWSAFSAFGIPLAAYLLPWRYLGSGDTVPAELLPISLIREGDFDFNEFAADSNVPYFYRAVGERLVSAYPIVPGLLNVPVYAIASLFGIDLHASRFDLSLVTAALLSALSVLFLYLALRRICESRRGALFFALVFAFGTCVWSVASRGMWQHGPSLLFLTFALWCLLARDERKIPFVGLVLGLAGVTRPSNFLIGIPVAVFLWRRHRRGFLSLLAWGTVPVLLASLYSAVYLDSPLLLGQAYRPGGFHGKIGVGLAGLLLSPSRGLFVFSPIFLFSVVGGVLAWRRGSDPLFRYLTVAALLVVLVYSRWGMWWGGVSFGYRVLLEIVPILIILLALAWIHWIKHHLFLRLLFVLFLAFSFSVQFLGVFAYPSGFDERIDLETARLWDIPESELVLSARKFLGVKAREEKAGQRALPAVWWSPEKNDDSIPGWLDSSPGGKLIRGPLEISGWAKSVAGEADVSIVLDDGRVVIPERFPRPDVAQVIPELGDTSRAGFRAVLQPDDPQPAERAFAVEFRDPWGGVRRLGPIRFRWVKAN